MLKDGWRTRLVAIYLLGEFVSLAVTAAILFWASGQLDWAPGWWMVFAWLA